MKHIILFLSFILVSSCNSKTEETVVDTVDKEKDSQRITAEDINKLTYTDYVLSPDAREAVINWQRYQELIMQIDYLKKADLSFFNGKNELLVNFLKDLRTDMPDTIATPAIKERLIALETKLLKLHSTLKLTNSQKSEVLENIKELLVANSNLHLQINKKFELDSQIIEDPSIDVKIEE